MPVQIPHDSALGKELWKWDHHTGEVWESSGGDRDDSIRGMRPREPKYFPTMLYKATTNVQGKVVCYEPMPPEYLFMDPNSYNRACIEVDVQNRQNTKTVHSAEEKAQAEREGWRASPTDALAFYEGLQQDIARAAAEAAFSVQRMSEHARGEFAAATQATHAHVVDVQGKKKPGRPRTIAPMDPSASEA